MTPVVLFDGACNLCSHSVGFIIDRDPTGRFRFASLQSDAGRSLLAQRGRTVPDPPDSVVLVEGERVSVESAAALRIARHLSSPWRWVWPLIALPAPLRDAVYRWIARNRYRWFGRSDACRLPSDALRDRFL